MLQDETFTLGAGNYLTIGPPIEPSVVIGQSRSSYGMFYFPFVVQFGARGQDAPSVLYKSLGRDLTSLVLQYGTPTTRLLPYGNARSSAAGSDLATLTFDIDYILQGCRFQTRSHSVRCFVRCTDALHELTVNSRIPIPRNTGFSIEVEGPFNHMLVTFMLVPVT
jgi:hypothetical protein